MIPSAAEREEFERNAMLSRLSQQVAQLLVEHQLSDAEAQQVLDAARRELTLPEVATVVDAARMRLSGR